MMAPLPDALQRPGKTAPFAMDLLGIAPGASYRWVAPGATQRRRRHQRRARGDDRRGAPTAGAERDHGQHRLRLRRVRLSQPVPGRRSAVAEHRRRHRRVERRRLHRRERRHAPDDDGRRRPVGRQRRDERRNDRDSRTSTTSSSRRHRRSIPDSGAIDVGATTLDDISSANPQDPAMAGARQRESIRGDALQRHARILERLRKPGERVRARATTSTRSFAAARMPDTVGLAESSAARRRRRRKSQLRQRSRCRSRGSPAIRSTARRKCAICSSRPARRSRTRRNPTSGSTSARRSACAASSSSCSRTPVSPVQPGHRARRGARPPERQHHRGRSTSAMSNDGVFITALDPSYIKLDGPFTRALIDSTQSRGPAAIPART